MNRFVVTDSQRQKPFRRRPSRLPLAWVTPLICWLLACLVPPSSQLLAQEPPPSGSELQPVPSTPASPEPEVTDLLEADSSDDGDSTRPDWVRFLELQEQVRQLSDEIDLLGAAIQALQAEYFSQVFSPPSAQK
ncbi:MAG: hypothetical protein JW797_19180 [Bradymonadales bacterium]|nr:hypothetical protein [Bradymonadales bacterium]